jgi:hypothetical protein
MPRAWTTRSRYRQRIFTPLLKRAGLPHMRFHDLRHSCATLLLPRGVLPNIIQELLGHATRAVTLDTYSHVMPSIGDATAKAIEEALARACRFRLSSICRQRAGIYFRLSGIWHKFYLQIEWFLGWACLDSNQGPLPYQRSVTAFWGFPQFTNILQMAVFLDRSSSRHFRMFTRVAARLLHTMAGLSYVSGFAAKTSTGGPPRSGWSSPAVLSAPNRRCRHR